MKETKHFSMTLMRQDMRSNRVLAIACILILCIMTVVVTFASNLLTGDTDGTDYSDVQNDFYSHLYVLASFNEANGTELSYDNFINTEDKTMYDNVFEMASAQSDEISLSSQSFEEAGKTLEASELGIDTYIDQFEYVYALDNVQGCFTGEDLDAETMMNNMLEMMGVSTDLVDTMSEMDTSSMLNQMYFTVMVLLPILLFVIFAGNALIVDQVDKGSMAYILSTPTKRSAVVSTQATYMVIMPFIMILCGFIVKIIASYFIVGDANVAKNAALYGGMYLLAEAMGSICFLASCIFNLSKNAMALGGGLNVFFFICSLLGLFGSDNLVSMGVGVEELSFFNNVSIVSLFDIDALGTVGSGDVSTAFIPKLIALAVIAIVCYVVGSIRFEKRDLPL